MPVSRPYNFCRNDTLQRRRVNSARHGTESISFLGPKKWDLGPSNIKLTQFLSIFKRKIWVPLQCQYRLCKIYLQHVGFIQWTPENSQHRNGTAFLSAKLQRRSFGCFFDQFLNKCVCVYKFVRIYFRNSFGKDCISCSEKELTLISSMLLL